MGARWWVTIPPFSASAIDIETDKRSPDCGYHELVVTFDMSLAEVKSSIQKMTIDQRLEVAAFIAHLNKSQDPEYLAESDRRMSAMDTGKKANEPDVLSLHENLSKNGR